MATFFANLFGGGAPQQQGLPQQGSQGPQGAPQPNVQPAQPFQQLSGNQQPQPQPGTQGAQPNNGGDQKPVSPLDAFSGLWQTAKNPDGTPKEPPKDPWEEPLLAADPAKIMESASKYDFMRSVPPELLQKATSGDIQSLMQIINHVGQQALGVGAQLSSASIEHSGKGIKDRFERSFDGRFKQASLSNLPSKNPILQHEAAAPMLRMIREQAQAANPQWTPEQVADYAEQYLTQFATSLSPGKQTEQQNGNGEPDWLSWVSKS